MMRNVVITNMMARNKALADIYSVVHYSISEYKTL